MKHIILFLVLTLVKVLPTQAQWYFDTSIVDSEFTQSENKGVGATNLESISGFRDLSYSFGRLFSINKVPKSGEEAYDAYIKDYQSPWLLFGLGIGFEQLSIKTNTNSDGFIVPIDYEMAQFQGRLGVYLMPTLFKINQKPVQLNLSGAVVYDFFTHATQSFTGITTNLRDFDLFDNSYPAYAFGAGLSLFVNRSTRLYAKYEIENAFGLSENNLGARVENYSIDKQKISVGILVDLKLRNNIKKHTEQKTKDLEDKNNNINNLQNSTNNLQDVDISALKNQVATLENELDDQKKNIRVVRNLLGVETGKGGGFKYFSNFRHVLFTTDNTSFDQSVYTDQLMDVVAFMSQNPTLKLNLVGYADTRGGETYNNALSLSRGKSVYDYLVQLGVEPYRMEYFGAGETMLFSIGGLSDNRRTEIIIMEQKNN